MAPGSFLPFHLFLLRPSPQTAGPPPLEKTVIQLGTTLRHTCIYIHVLCFFIKQQVINKLHNYLLTLIVQINNCTKYCSSFQHHYSNYFGNRHTMDHVMDASNEHLDEHQ